MSNKDLITFLDVDSSESLVPKLSTPGFVALSVFLGFIMTFGFLNNFVVLVLFCKFKKLRTPVNLLLLNISVSDMLVCLCGTTMSFASSVRGRWLLGRTGCMWYGFINSCFVPPLLGWSSYGLEGAGTSCSVTWTDNSSKSHSYIICLLIFCLGLPVLVMVYSYGRLLYAVKQLGKIRKTARRRDYHLLIMVITTVVCYLLCWTPYSVVAIMATFGPPGIITPVASIIPSVLAKSSTVINPIIYIFMNKQFYRCFLMLLGVKERSGVTESQYITVTKNTVMQLERIVNRDPEACTAHAPALLREHRCSIIATEQSSTN
ncbi:teleost multiple tissue opsin 2b isoform X2 [Tachysurus fulvidraco]|uniref:teleost multiple tissue opsin 2b isoform X2 n=1 Tax=Tachysurus fulvidraco TaxID=1234273 RepID=UPI000F50A67A|nr:teleost multiple tissue opsin 2b isoform X2 [Tachysurus fulvidraco]